MSFVQSINRKNLRIARENIGLISERASSKISSTKKNLVAEWESGDSLPTWAQLTRLAKLYNVSEFVLLSDDAIQKNKAIPDYRTGVEMSEESREKIAKLVNLVITRQKWLEQSLKDEGYSKNKLQGSGKDIENPERLASFMAAKLGIKLEEIKAIRGYGARDRVLDYLFQKAEDVGIFAGKTVSYHKLTVNDLRGLFISNDYCPFIIINRKDSSSAQIFSFVHELAHLFRKSDSISNSLEFRTIKSAGNQEEVFCNKVAAIFLLPDRELTERFYDKQGIDRLSELFKMSKLAIFYRLKEIGKIDNRIEQRLEREIQYEMTEAVMQAEAQRSKNEGGNYVNAMRDSNGPLFNRVVTSLYFENKISYTEASNILRFSVEQV
jgi:Zn-dependent peptidase ImmA (M78 family)